jgi:hypothetical protein
MSESTDTFPPIVELNVGGVFYSTTLSTLTKEPDSLLGQIFTGKVKNAVIKDSKGKYFLDRDGVLFRYVLDYLRNQKLILPENFHEKERLKNEAEYYRLSNMVQCISNPGGRSATRVAPNSIIPTSNSTGELTLYPEKDPKEKGYILVGYRGTFAFGRDGLADVKFRKVSRILVCGRVSLCRVAFRDTLNESRDPDRGDDSRYTARFFLKHSFLEQAFDSLLEAGFEMVGSCASGTNSQGELKPGVDSEESKWNHYNEFIFCRS